MKPGLRYAGQLLLLGLMIYCFGMSILSSESYSQNSSVYMLYQKSDPISGEEAIKMQEKEEEEDDPLEFTVWGIQEDTELKNEELERKINGTALYIAGSADLLFDYEGVFEKDDQEGCLLSEDLAYDLFGSKNVKDLKVKIGEKELVVVGLLKEAMGTIVLQAEKGTDKIMDSATLLIPAGKLPSSILDNFNNRHGFGKDTAAFLVFKDFAKLTVMLIPLIMGIYLAYVWGKRLSRMRKQENSVSWFFICLVGGICFFAFYIKITGINFAIPQDFTPTRWSDFSFWSDLMKEKQSELLTLFSVEKREPEIILVRPFLQTIKYSAFTLAIYLFFIRCMKMKSSVSFYTYILCSFFFAYMAILINKEYAQILAVDKRLWMLAAIYLAGAYLLKMIPGKT